MTTTFAFPSKRRPVLSERKRLVVSILFSNFALGRFLVRVQCDALQLGIIQLKHEDLSCTQVNRMREAQISL